MKKIGYKYGTEGLTETDKQKIVSDFLFDISHCKPLWAYATKTYCRFYFHGEKYSILYIMPVSYKKYIPQENK